MVLVRFCHYPSGTAIATCRLASSTTLNELKARLRTRLASTIWAGVEFTRWFLASAESGTAPRTYTEVDNSCEDEVITSLGIVDRTQVFLEGNAPAGHAQSEMSSSRAPKRKREDDGCCVKDEREEEPDEAPSNLPANIQLLMEYPKAELARMNLDATTKAANAQAAAAAAEALLAKTKKQLAKSKARESMLTASATSAKISADLLEIEVRMLEKEAERNRIASAAAFAMMKHPSDPFAALWEVLTDSTISDPSCALSIIYSPCCGVSKYESYKERRAFWANGQNWKTSSATPLILAILADRLDVIKALVDKSGDSVLKEKVDSTLSTLLHRAVSLGREEIVQYLIDKKVEINAKSPSGYTPLHTAAKYGTLNCAKLLLAGGARLTATDKKGMQALHHAAENGQSKVVQVLLDERGDAWAKCNEGEYPLFYAKESEDTETISILRTYMKLNKHRK